MRKARSITAMARWCAHPQTGRYRRTRLFVLTLGYSREAVRLLVWQSSTQVWAELQERASSARWQGAGLGMAAVLDTRLRQAQTEKVAPIDLVSALVADELRRRRASFAREVVVNWRALRAPRESS
jgi:hypothetical protein